MAKMAKKDMASKAASRQTCSLAISKNFEKHAIKEQRVQD